MSRSTFSLSQFAWLPANTIFANAIGVMIACVCVSVYGDDTTAREPQPKSWQADAELTDVFFIDENLGWVVGESGTTLRTRDGGNTWNAQALNASFRKDTVELQQKFRNLGSGQLTNSTGVTSGKKSTSPITCRFDSVHFVDANQGWAVGGFQLPYINRTQAVVIRTRDGGITWQPVSDLAIPRLRKVKFATPRQGIAYGDSGNVFTGGIFTTNDAGSSWSAISSQTDAAWIDAEQTTNRFVTINDAGQLGRYENDQYAAAVLLGSPAANKIDFRCVKMIDSNQGVAVGTQGSLFKTNNGGLSWQRLPIESTHPRTGQLRLANRSRDRSKSCLRWFSWLHHRHVGFEIKSALHRQNTCSHQTQPVVFLKQQNGLGSWRFWRRAVNHRQR